MDGIVRRRGGVRERLLHVEGVPVVLRAAQPAPDRIVIGAFGEAPRDIAEEALARMRFALGVDDDLSEFYERFRDDPLIGLSVRARPWLRPLRRAEPFEALAWAICEQLIEFERATAIERRIVRALGSRCPVTGLRDAPSAGALAGAAPAQLQSFDLAASRAITLVKAAREVARGWTDLRCSDHERGWARLRRIPGIGSWTVECLALHGQGRLDQLPAGDLAYIKLVARLRTGGDPAARATEEEVREFFAPYDGWAGLAGAHALRAATPAVATASVRRPRPAGTRSSASSAQAAA
jgi:3-methyladenine DNA glycosylase/8-oxoguanine DNA glycosylase